MSHIFDPKKFKKLDSEERRKALPIKEVLEVFKDIKGHIADVGCGIGYFSFPFAEHFDVVHAIDISPIMIDELKRRNQMDNIQIALGDFSDLLADDSQDVFFTATVIHELDDLSGFTEHAIRKLKIGGTIAYLDFEKKEGSMGPPMEKRVASSTVEELFRKMNLKDIKTHKIGQDFYLTTGIYK